MLKIKSNINLDLDKLAIQHFNYLNKRVKSGKKKGHFHSNSLINKIAKQISTSKGNEKRFFQFLMGRSQSRIKKLLIGSPTELHQIIEEFHNSFPITLLLKPHNGDYILNSFGEKIQKIFDYKSYRSSEFCADYLVQLGFEDNKPCPYCNVDSICVINVVGQNQTS